MWGVCAGSEGAECGCETVYLNKVEVAATQLHYISPREVLNTALRMMETRVTEFGELSCTQEPSHTRHGGYSVSVALELVFRRTA